MRKGKVKEVKWYKYSTYDFKIPLSNTDDYYKYPECGAYALYAITKKSSKSIMKLGKNGHWPTKVMLTFLKKHGWHAERITMGNMVEVFNDISFKRKITNNHLILIDQACFGYENTWSVIYRNTIMHSGSVNELNSLEFVNYPIEDAYVIYRKSWL